MAHPWPGGGSPRRGPAAGDGGQGRGAERNDPPAGADWSASSGPAPAERAPEQAAANGAAVTGAGTNPAGPRVNRTNGSGARPDGAAGNGANGHASRRPGPWADGGEVGRSDLNNDATASRPPHASGWAPPGVGPDPVPAAAEADSPLTAPMNPWATGLWTAGPPHAPETAGVASATRSADSSAGDVPAPEPESLSLIHI